MNEHLSLSSTIVLAPRRSGLHAGRDNVVDILVRVQAPDATAATMTGHTVRPPQALALVIDRSGSMAGRPLAEARRCAEFVVSRLRPVDAVALVQFDNRVERLWPAVPLGTGAEVRSAIGRIEDGGSTNLHGGWLDGAQSLGEVAGFGLKRVILLSDGCANQGLTDSEQIAAECAAWAGRGVTTSTYGLGEHFNEDLMVAMARAGGGNHYYGDTAEDLMEPFQQELDLLANLALRGVTLAVSAHDGLGVEMLNDLPGAGTGWRLPDLAWGAEAWAVLRIKVPVAAMGAVGSHLPILRVHITGESLDGEPVELERAALSLPVLSPAAFDALTDDELVQRRLAELAAGKALKRMREAARAGNWRAVDAMLQEAQARFAGNDWVAGMLNAMAGVAASRSRERMSKEAMYSASRLNSRLAPKAEAARSADDVELAAYMRRKPLQGKGEL